MKIYIAGKITGDPNYKEKFKVAEERLTQEGHVGLNPAILPEGLMQENYIHICKAMIDVCEAVYFLNDWTTSKGAKTEMEYATVTGKELIFQA